MLLGRRRETWQALLSVARVHSSHDIQPASVDLPPLTPEKVQRALDRIAAIRERIRRRGVDIAHLPDPVEELLKARAAGAWE